MQTYEVHIQCEACGAVHAYESTVSLEEGPQTQESLAKVYGDRELPPQIHALRNSQIFCPTSRFWVTQRDRRRQFLVPSAP